MPEKNRVSNQTVLRYVGLGTQWLAMLGLAVWGGLALDEKLGFKALFVVAFPLVALVVSLWQLIRTFNKPNS